MNTAYKPGSALAPLDSPAYIHISYSHDKRDAERTIIPSACPPEGFALQTV